VALNTRTLTHKYHTTASLVKWLVLHAPSTVDSGLDPWSGQTKHYKIGVCYISANDAALASKNKDWLA
jgi:hypothetical protein